MSKVLVRKAERPVMMVGGGDSKIMVPIGPSRKKNMPDVMPHRLSGADLSARRIEGAKAAGNLAVMPRPSEMLDPNERALAQVAHARSKRAVEAAQPRSFDEQYAGDAAERFYDNRVGVGSRGKLTDKDLERGVERGEGARNVGVMGRQFGRGLAGALGGLSFLTGLESAGAAGAGLEQGLGSAAFRAQTAYGQTAPELANLGGEAGARIGAGGVGVRHRLDDRAAARAARQPVAVAEPTAPQRGPVPQPPRHAPLTNAERAGLESEQSRLQSALSYNRPGTLPNFENRLVGIDRRLNPGTSGLPFDMRGGAYNTDVFEPVPQFDPTSQAPGAQPGQSTLSSLIGVGAPAQPTVAASPTIQPMTDPNQMASAFGAGQKEEEIAPPTGGKDAAEAAGATLAAEFSGKRPSMSDMGVKE